MLSPLPDDRWLIFVNRDDADTRREIPQQPSWALCSMRGPVSMWG